MTMISSNLQSVHARIAAACKAAGRDVKDVTLLAVSKTFGPDAVLEAVAAGQAAFGENYIQEAVEKIHVIRGWETARPGEVASHGEDAGLRLASSRHSFGLRSPQAGPLSSPTEWHCVGPIQSNKTRLVAENFDWAHTVDRLKIAQRLSEQRPVHLPPLQVCIQVNIDGGPTKAGVPPEEALALARAVASLPRLVLRGLICIPEPAHDFIADCALLTRARALFDQILWANRALAPSAAVSGSVSAPAAVPETALLQLTPRPSLPPLPPLSGFARFDTLSMGMTGDLEAAIHAGSTMVRVGTAIFGGRVKPAAPPASSHG